MYKMRNTKYIIPACAALMLTVSSCSKDAEDVIVDRINTTGVVELDAHSNFIYADQDEVSVLLDGEYQIKYYADKDVKYTFASADESIAKVSADGKVTGVKEGETEVTLTVGDHKEKIKVSVIDAPFFMLDDQMIMIDAVIYRSGWLGFSEGDDIEYEPMPNTIAIKFNPSVDYSGEGNSSYTFEYYPSSDMDDYKQFKEGTYSNLVIEKIKEGLIHVMVSGVLNDGKDTKVSVDTYLRYVEEEPLLPVGPNGPIIIEPVPVPMPIG